MEVFTLLPDRPGNWIGDEEYLRKFEKPRGGKDEDVRLVGFYICLCFVEKIEVGKFARMRTTEPVPYLLLKSNENIILSKLVYYFDNTQSQTKLYQVLKYTKLLYKITI